MVKEYKSLKYGSIEYVESIWTGKKSLTINGAKARPVSKTMFSVECDGELVNAVVTGNIYKGSALTIGDERFEIYPKTIWYEYVLAILPFILIMIWGNSIALCSIVPVIAGGLGGAISGGLGVLSLSIMKSYKNPVLKLAMGFAFLVATFLICAILGVALVSALN